MCVCVCSKQKWKRSFFWGDDKYVFASLFTLSEVESRCTEKHLAQHAAAAAADSGT